MSDIITTIQDALSPDTIRKISNLSGESPQSTQAALTVAAPTILYGLLGHTARQGAALSSLEGPLLTGRINSGLLTNLGLILHGPDGVRVFDIGQRILYSVFGGKLVRVQSLIAAHSGVRFSSVSRLMALAGSLIAAAVGKFLGGAPTRAELVSFLSSQRVFIHGGLPSRLIQSLNRLAIIPRPKPAHPTVGSVARTVGWPAVGVMALSTALYLLLDRPIPNTARATAAEPLMTIADTTTPAISGLGREITRALPTGAPLQIPASGIENKLIDFIEDPARPANKTTWFDFDRLRFDTGKATLRPSSREQLENIAAILKAYPRVVVKIGAYTDNVGDEEENFKLSGTRAKNVMDQLASLGVAAGRITAEGYGEQHPIADNASEFGRAQNRRISLRVLAK